MSNFKFFEPKWVVIAKATLSYHNVQYLISNVIHDKIHRFYVLIEICISGRVCFKNKIILTLNVAHNIFNFPHDSQPLLRVMMI